MEPKILSVKPTEDLTLLAVFQDGTEKTYNIRALYPVLPQFRVFETDKVLFFQVQVDPGGYGVSWNDDLDLDANDILENGIDTKQQA